MFDEGNFLVLRGFLRAKAGDFFVCLIDALAQLRFLTGARRAAQIEEFHLSRHDLGDIRHIGLVHQLVRKRDAVGAVALGRQARLAGEELGQCLGHDREIGLGDRVVEAYQKIADLHPIAVLDAQLSDDTPCGVLDLFDV